VFVAATSEAVVEERRARRLVRTSSSMRRKGRYLFASFVDVVMVALLPFVVESGVEGSVGVG